MTEVRGRRGRVQRWEGKRKDDRGGREKCKRTEVGRERKDDRSGREKRKWTEVGREEEI